MQLRFVIWAWEGALSLLAKEDARLAEAVGRGCAPLAADQRRVSVADVAVGCWQRSALDLLAQPRPRALLEGQLGKALDIRVAAHVMPWPGGAESETEAPPSPFLPGASRAVLAEAAKCESPLERYFLAHASRRGLQLVCQYPVGLVRLDFAVPRQRIGADILGWWRRGPAFTERSQQVGEVGWRIVTFAGEEVYRDVAACVNALASALRR